MEDIDIKENSIRLDQFLKLAGLVLSGGEAKTLIQTGMVKVNNQREQRRGRQLKDEDVVTMPDGSSLRVCVKGDESVFRKDQNQ